MSRAKSGAGGDEAKPPGGGQIIIPEFNFREAQIKVIGVTSLICHAFPQKEKQRMIESRQTDQSTAEKPRGGKKTARAVRDFLAEYRDSLYPLDDGSGHGFPSIAFKRAIVGACRQVSNLDMTMANRIIFVKSEGQSKGFGCVRIQGTPRKREDVVRLSGIDKPPDIRYRGEFWPWSAVLSVEFNESLISFQGVLRLLQFAGKCEGVGEQRPSAPKKPGDNGQFRIAEEGDDDETQAPGKIGTQEDDRP
jgi:hypothetical protein